jgi:hypothetical protein
MTLLNIFVPPEWQPATVQKRKSVSESSCLDDSEEEDSDIDSKKADSKRAKTGKFKGETELHI